MSGNVTAPYRLPTGQIASPIRSCVRVLSLSGGGYRGLFTARLLSQIEAMDEYGGEPIGRRFDVIVGTSVGGLIAAALALDISARDVYDLLVEWGPSIFPKLFLKNLRKTLSKRVYSAEPLERAIEKCLGPTGRRSLAALEKPLALTAVSWSRGELRLLRSAGLAAAAADTCSIFDATRATSAAPAHFPAMNIDGDWFVDGGLAANCPDLHALSEARRLCANVRMLSIGTSGATRENVPGSIPQRGITWAKPALDLAIQAQERIAQAECERALKDDYLRLNNKPGIDQRELRELDNATANTTVALRSLADARFESLKNNAAERRQLDRLVSPILI